MENLSLYIHIPFCSKKCSYCDFYSRTPRDKDELKAYFSKITEELDSALNHFKPLNIPTVYIGGGTPSIISPDLFDGFLQEIRRRLPGSPLEWSCEANPESLSSEHLDVFSLNGISRLSLGIQSFNNDELMTLGRGASLEDIYGCLEMIKREWSGSWNGDLICDIPGQTKENARNDIKNLTSYNPSHVSLYTLSLEPGTLLAEKYAKTAKCDIENDLAPGVWREAREYLERSGWQRYEISNYAVNGEECRHNIGYWEMKPFLGIGPSASSTLPGNNGPFRLTNNPNLDEYLSSDFKDNGSIRYCGIEGGIGYKDFFLEHLMMGFRLIRGVNEERLKRIFGHSIENLLPEWCSKYQKEGTLQKEGHFWRIREEGADYLNRIVLDAYIELEKQGDSQFRNVIIDWQ